MSKVAKRRKAPGTLHEVTEIVDTQEEGEVIESGTVQYRSYNTAGPVATPVDADEADDIADYIKQVKDVDNDLSFIFDMLKEDHGQKWAPKNHVEGLNQRMSDIEFVSRAEEESFLREPAVGSQERPCVHDAQCQGTKLYGAPKPVVLVEHLTLSERQPGCQPSARKPCILCKRAAVNYAAINAQTEGTDNSKLFHRHGNFVNQEREYDESQCLIAGTRETHSVLVPCVILCRPYLHYVRQPDGTARFEQRGYNIPRSDF
jgi:hypothetical protein